jgi:hypothetical protein
MGRLTQSFPIFNGFGLYVEHPRSVKGEILRQAQDKLGEVREEMRVKRVAKTIKTNAVEKS